MSGEQLERPIDAIKVGRRFRRDLGDLGPLQASIQRLDLLEPIVIDANDRLVAGLRRLRALKALGRTTVPVRIVPLTGSAALHAEWAENKHRKAFTPSERVQIKKAIATLAKEEAKRRQARTGEPRSAKLGPNDPKGRSRDAVAKTLGMSHESMRKAEAVVDAAIRQEMDQTGNVDAAYRKLQEARGTRPNVTPGPPRSKQLHRDQLSGALELLKRLKTRVCVNEWILTTAVVEALYVLMSGCKCDHHCEHRRIFEGEVRHALTCYTQSLEATMATPAAVETATSNVDTNGAGDAE
jgi:ParB-like chromosome segregation protein Spo0J